MRRPSRPPRKPTRATYHISPHDTARCRVQAWCGGGQEDMNMMDYGRKRNNGMFFRAMVAHVIGMSAEDFVDHELRLMQCEWCRLGWPLEGGQHDLFGIKMPCDAAE